MDVDRKKLRRLFARYLRARQAAYDRSDSKEEGSRAVFEYRIAWDEKEGAELDLMEAWPHEGHDYPWAVIIFEGRTYVVNPGEPKCEPAIVLDLDDG
jgi:hypothetical protein